MQLIHSSRKEDPQCSLPPLRLHSPVQCCLIKTAQGSTVKRLNAKRKQTVGTAGGRLFNRGRQKNLLKPFYSYATGNTNPNSLQSLNEQ